MRTISSVHSRASLTESVRLRRVGAIALAFSPWRHTIRVMTAESQEVCITGLFIYPVKSCRGISVAEVQIGPRGFWHDREFLVVDAEDNFLTQRNAPELATVQIELGEAGLELAAPSAGALRLSFETTDDDGAREGHRCVTIFNDQVLADDAGDAAAEWFSTVLHRPCRLVRIGAFSSRRVPPERIAATHRGEVGPEVSFTDAFPTLVVSEESLADLNARLPKSIPMNRFRPNIVVRGCAPYDENKWDVVRAGEIVFGCARTCLRCVITSTDQETGMRQGAEPLRTLATYRRSPDGSGVIFGQYLIHTGAGKLRVGDALVAEGLSAS